MTPVVVGIAVGLVGVVAVWLVASVPRLRPTFDEADRTPAEEQGDAEAIVAAAEAKAAKIVAAADTVIAEARETAGRAAAEIRDDAKRTARRIIKEAEERALELVEAAELQRVQAERAAVHAQEFAEQSRRDFAELIRTLLARLDPEFAAPATNGRAPVESEEAPISRAASGSV